MLEQFTIETFRPHVGESFRVGAETASIELELVAAEALGGDAAVPRGRVPFSLVFRGPSEPVLPQRIYRFEHGDLGAFEIFIVPIGPDDSRMRYEAIFT